MDSLASTELRGSPRVETLIPESRRPAVGLKSLVCLASHIVNPSGGNICFPQKTWFLDTSRLYSELEAEIWAKCLPGENSL